ncbi:MAG TPA: alkaline phosphatase D family protein [Caulobacteraceae bacterium]|jgi:alkaline phosphatase D
MIRPLLACAAAGALLACTPTQRAGPRVEVAPPSPERPAVSAESTPVRGDPPPLPAADRVLTRIALGSCNEETKQIPIFAAIEAAKPDLFLYLGDNVYGDAKPGDTVLPELRQAYEDLAFNAHFSAFNMAVPMLATWDDHDYGASDGDGTFVGREVSEKLFETFWGAAALGGEHPGVYGARTFGPPGKRVQVIMLDTRFFRSPFKRGEPLPSGRETYAPDPDPAKTMLGEAQWAWLAEELSKPAEVRLLVSSVQVLTESHAFDSWRPLPVERERLYRTIRESGAKGVVLLTGDQHVGALFRKAGAIPYPLHELSTSALNMPSRNPDPTIGPTQVGPIYAPENFGLVEIDWSGRRVDLSIRGLDGATHRRITIPFRDLGHT